MQGGLRGVAEGRDGQGSVDLPVLVGVAVATLLMLATLFALVMMSFDHCDLRELLLACLMLGPTTVALALYVTWGAIRQRRDPNDATSAVLCGASIAGGANVPLVVLLVGLVTMTHPGHLVWALVVGAIGGMILGCPFGFVFGAACLPPIRFGAARPSSLDAGDRAAALCWRWLTNLSASCAAVIAGGLLLFEGHHDGALALLFACVALAVVGVWAGRGASARLAHRKLWLDLVGAGHVAGWAVVGRDEVGAEGLESLPSFFDHQRAPGDSRAVLVRRLPPREPGGAYRSAEHSLPVAFVDRIDR